MNETTSPDRTVSETTDRQCYCGCGSPVPARSFYRPGHDSRHVGQVARKLAQSDSWDTLTSELPTKALQLRAWNMAYRLHEQAQRHAAREIRRLSPKARTKR